MANNFNKLSFIELFLRNIGDDVNEENAKKALEKTKSQVGLDESKIVEIVEVVDSNFN